MILPLTRRWGFRGRNRRHTRPRMRTRARLHLETLDGRLLLDCGCGMTIQPPADMDMSGMDDPEMQRDYQALMSLVPQCDATHTANHSGNWSEIWGNNRPGEGARVWIPAGVTVTVDGQFPEALDWIRVDGTLRFAIDRDTSLKVETIIADTTGRVEIGTESQPIAADRTARIVFADTGPIDRTCDPLGLSRGLITHGGLSLYGSETTGFVDLAKTPMMGDTVLKLSSVPTNWRPGGRVVVPGVDPSTNQDEELTILSIRENLVTVDRPLKYNHKLPDGVTLPLAYLDRNVELTSENQTDPDRRGHVMLMHHSDQDRVVAYAELDGLGRTRADRMVTDPELDEHGNLLPPRDAEGDLLPEDVVPAGTRNDRGRYALHFHHTGEDPMHPILVKGISVDGGLKWGVVNHKSNVVVEDSVSFNVDGAAFVTESGTELGAFRHNLAIRSYGSRDNRKEGKGSVDLAQKGQKASLSLIGGDDLGFQGYGFWMQGPLVRVQDNIAIGHAKEGFAFFLKELMRGDQIPVSNLPAGTEALKYDLRRDRPAEFVRVDSVPFTFVGNTVLGSRSGLGVYGGFDNKESRLYSLTSKIQDSTFANVRSGFIAYYASQLELKDVRMINDPAIYPMGLPQDAGSETYGDSGDITWDNVRIENFRRGIVLPNRGQLEVRGGFFRNMTNIYIDSVGNSQAVLKLDSSNFAAPSAAAIKAMQSGQPNELWNIYLSKSYNAAGTDFTPVFDPIGTSVVLIGGDGQTRYVYFRESGRNYRFNTTDTPDARRLAGVLPDSILGMTAGELWDRYGLAVNGVIAPADASVVPGILGVVASTPPVTPTPVLTLASARFTNQVQGYKFQVRDPQGNVIDLATANLQPDAWNFVTANYGGRKVTELIYAKVTPATLRLTDSSYKTLSPPTTITTNQLKTGFTLYGMIMDTIDNKTTKTRYSRTFSPSELVVDPDGKVRLWAEFTDVAGNVSRVQVVLTVV